MLMIVDRSDTIPVAHTLRQTAACYAATPSRGLRMGDRIRMPADRGAVEIVLGFRPGVDVLVIEESPAQKLLTTEEGGSAVIIDRRGRRIVLEGVELAALRAGDIDVTAC